MDELEILIYNVYKWIDIKIILLLLIYYNYWRGTARREETLSETNSNIYYITDWILQT